jgi:hypothetical protein
MAPRAAGRPAAGLSAPAAARPVALGPCCGAKRGAMGLAGRDLAGRRDSRGLGPPRGSYVVRSWTSDPEIAAAPCHPRAGARPRGARRPPRRAGGVAACCDGGRRAAVLPPVLGNGAHEGRRLLQRAQRPAGGGRGRRRRAAGAARARGAAAACGAAAGRRVWREHRRQQRGAGAGTGAGPGSTGGPAARRRRHPRGAREGRGRRRPVPGVPLPAGHGPARSPSRPQDLPSNDFNVLFQLLAGPQGYAARWTAEAAPDGDGAAASSGDAAAVGAAASTGPPHALRLHSAALGRSFYEPCFPRAYLHAAFCFMVGGRESKPGQSRGEPGLERSCCLQLLLGFTRRVPSLLPPPLPQPPCFLGPQSLHYTSRAVPMAATVFSWSDRVTAEERAEWRRLAGAGRARRAGG